MKQSSKIILCFAFGLICSVSIFGQEAKNDVVFEQYIDLNNLTIVFTKHIAITDLAPNLALPNPWYELSMTMYYTYKNKKPSNSKIYGITFESKGKKFRFIPEPQRALFIVADGERLSLGRMRLRETGRSKNYAMETLDLEIPRKTFEKLTKASAIEVELSSHKFSLKDENLYVLRRLNSYLASQLQNRQDK